MSYQGATKLYEQTGDKTISNSAVEQSIIGSGIGSLVLQPADFIVGGSLDLLVRGVYSAAAVAPALQVRVMVGATTLAVSTTNNLVALANNQPFAARMSIVCRAKGASGLLTANGELSFGVALAYWATMGLDNAGAVVPVDLSQPAIPIDVTVKFGVGNIANIIKVNQVRLLRL